MRKVLFLMCLFAFVFSSSAWAADVSGNWVLKMTGPMGEETVDLAITAKGSDLTIAGEHSSLGEVKGTGTLKDDAITMEIQATGEMAVGFAFTGKVSGNKMSGTREIKMSGGGGGAPGGAGGGEGGARGGGEGGAPGGAGGEGGGAGGEGGARGGAGGGESGARGGGEAGAATGGAGGGGGGMDMSSIPDTWTAEKK